MLKICGLNQFYGGSHTLRGVDLEVPGAACTAVLGRNGVGKTTLLRCLMGLVPLRSGSIAFAGTEIAGLPPYERARLGIGYVPQGREIFPRLTVAENLRVGEAAAGSAHSAESLDEIESLFPALKTMRSRPGGNLSGGQQQQLAIARALVARPKLLLLDEPTEGIQPSIIKEIERVHRELLARGITILLVEQYLEFATSLAEHYAIFSRGTVVEHGRIGQLQTDEVRRYLAL